MHSLIDRTGEVSLRAQADRSRGPERGSSSAQADRSHMTEGMRRSLNAQADRSHAITLKETH